MIRLLVEAAVVGILTTIAGTIVSYFVWYFFGVDLPPVCRDWNKNYAMEITLFLTGFIIHLFSEFTGINKWYCKHGYACLR